ALQLKAISYSFNLMSSDGQSTMMSLHQIYPVIPEYLDTAFIVAALLAVFCILFGAMRLDSTERHEGLVAAVAFESLVKLVAFLCVGLFVCYTLFNGFSDIFTQFLDHFPERDHLLVLGDETSSAAKWFTMTTLSMFAIMLLPRQFHIMVIENSDISHIRTAMWAFPAYMFLLNLFVLPIALGGLLHYDGHTALADYFVLTLPLHNDQAALAALVFIGGLSASAGMVMLESVASATMILNNLVMPMILRFNLRRPDISGTLLNIKRVAIALVIFLGYFYYQVLGETEALVDIGLISFMAATQFAPAFIGALYWERANGRAAATGLIFGFAIWVYTLIVPIFVESGWFPHDLIQHGLFGIEALRPSALFYLDNLDVWSHCLFWSMFFNAGSYVAISIASVPSSAEAAQAMRFVRAATWKPETQENKRISKAPTVMEFVDLMAKFIGDKSANKAISEYLGEREIDEKGSLSEYEIPSLNVLYDVANLINSGKSLDGILDSILDLLYRQFRFDLCGIRIIDEESNLLRVRSYRGMDSEFLSRADREINMDTCIGNTFINNKVVLANDSDCADKPASIAIVRELKIKSFAHAPITVEGQPVGVLSSYSRYAKGIYTDEFIELYKNIAAQIGIAYRNATQTAQLIEASEQQKQLKIAEDIQLDLLPKKMPEIEGLDIRGICVPAKQVGGDYFDFITHENELDIVVADVSGHNIGAALLMASARTFIQAHNQQMFPPQTTLETLNSFLYKDLSSSELFITMFYLRYELQNNNLIYANAGHNQPLIYHPESDNFDELDAEGMILGILPQIEFEQKEIAVESGDILVMYTDGIVEAQDKSEELFGLERFKELIRDNHTKSSKGIIDITLEETRMFQGRRHFNDDVTMVVVKIS
ncbi:MAG: SpoIIE family protein phosphatase, partial [Geobacteraceae bacterium]|nr:SpoIIE family protein phosphatase [Geobacteraceae bacterium]